MIENQEDFEEISFNDYVKHSNEVGHRIAAASLWIDSFLDIEDKDLIKSVMEINPSLVKEMESIKELMFKIKPLMDKAAVEIKIHSENMANLSGYVITQYGQLEEIKYNG